MRQNSAARKSWTRQGAGDVTRTFVLLTLAACALYGVSSGLRANYGILLGSISQGSGVEYASVSLVLAVSQLFFGIMQPVFGVVSMLRSSSFVLRCGSILMAAGLLLMPFCKSFWTLLIALGLVLPAGTAAIAFGIIMGVLTPKLPSSKIGTASGLVTASTGVGSTIIAPVLQGLSAAAGLLGSMVFFSVVSLLLFPVSMYLCRPVAGERQIPSAKREPLKLGSLLREATKDRAYSFLLAGFFTCGFHMAIIETHFYSEVVSYGFDDNTAAYAISVYGITTMLGAILSGTLCGRFPMKNILAALYASRVLMVPIFLLLPKTGTVVFGFAALLGLTGSATVPPTSGLTERLFGAAKLGTMFGVVFLAHQMGSFFSAWLGGICVSATGTHSDLDRGYRAERCGCHSELQDTRG